MSGVYITFALYFVALLTLGVIAWRRTQDLSDYILGGRSLGSGVTALSAGASDMSGWLLLGLPGAAYVSGLEAGWIALGLLIGTWLNWLVVATRLRTATERLDDSLTLPDYFQRRFADNSRILRILPGLFIFLFFSAYVASGLVAGGRLFEEVFGLSYMWAVSTGVLAIIIYTFLGGYLAVSWTDALQALLMLLALVAVPIMVFSTGDTGLFEAVNAKNPELLNPFTNASGEAIGVIAIISAMAWGLGYFGQPHILARFMGIREVGQLTTARRIAVSWAAIGLVAALLVGLAGIGGLETTLTGADTEKVFMRLVDVLFHPLVAGICLAAILAAIMSTADSQLLVASSVVSEDFWKGLLRPDASQTELVWVGRISVIVIALVAFWFARDPESKVLELVAYAWAGLGAAFGPVIVMSLFWSRMSRAGAIAGMLAGGVTVVVWAPMEGGLFDVYEILPGAIFAALAGWIFSLIVPDDRATEQYQRMLD
ncbi:MULTISPECIES: sodium/proline symporter PutP [unclassified Wenzhouxiangella]|uniref:sodium/proline symporter PutP n=1 Tax=unclassified Wenzhouxiangella TaxID=2613841 RepID=UPI000E326041|nr:MULTISPECIES: sodium/proline symporter PutP [unclassified Wenzhouxiangella]RFF27040.1 sodium/proline symporter PutP [Wenzhouxiangella sp. 15181]RFP67543.1 sodium/proline symporter PutP [Wenzhouxiangella sp. 15190]